MIKQMLLESKLISEEFKYHVKNDIPISRNIFRAGSEKFFDVINEARNLRDKGYYKRSEDDFLLNTDIGKWGVYNGHTVPLDYPQLDVALSEAEYQGKNVELNKPKRGGSKKFYVYVKDPKSGNVRKVSFGAADGGGKLSVKFKDPERRKAFANRHDCKNKKDKTKAGYWSCRLPRYAKSLGLGNNMNTYW